MGWHFLLWGILPTQESNPGLPHCRQTLYHLSYPGNPHYVLWRSIWLFCTVAQLYTHLTHAFWMKSFLPELPLVLLFWFLFISHHSFIASTLGFLSSFCPLYISILFPMSLPSLVTSKIWAMYYWYMLFTLKFVLLFHIIKTCWFYFKMIPLRIWPLFFKPLAIALLHHLSFGLLKDILK